MIPDPDGYIGTLLAIEGVSDARTILNSPSAACRAYPMHFMRLHNPRETTRKRRSTDVQFFFGQSRMPCTYLDSDDYIFGSTQKLQKVLSMVAGDGDALLAVVNSPGASLIGDDLQRFLVEAHLDHICMIFESAAYSRPFPEGFDEATVSILRWLRLNRLPRLKKRVNLLGFSMIQKHWQGNIAELRHLCDLMGLTVVAVPGGGSSVSELRESTTASCNIVVFPEYSHKTAQFYKTEFGIPIVYSPDGAPVGFTATEAWIQTVASATGCDPAPALAEIKRLRTHAYRQIALSHQDAGYPKGATFAIRGDSSFIYPLSHWLFEYLGMIPVSVEIMPSADPETSRRFENFLAANNLPNALNADPAVVNPDFYFGVGLAGKDLELSGKCRTSIELFNRVTSDVHFTQMAYLGGQGALWILELIFNAVKGFPE